MCTNKFFEDKRQNLFCFDVAAADRKWEPKNKVYTEGRTLKGGTVQPNSEFHTLVPAVCTNLIAKNYVFPLPQKRTLHFLSVSCLDNNFFLNAFFSEIW